ncbi:similar to Saccharomyces cerevisiae YGL010W Putative protein of unknown function [Maudiozyma barnettii]|uniref:Uncharacterized protein n=1 Tax=Maudiozyma barnettii TaxID=61262 RepID=A0A8H2VK17_9SACH|nr:Mpo1p [Kazachstania barnettii]CAB4256739.1 similar to Saccharomyces cerevisiae YGL010W Putative protein of unknown function [Kazachstania barnettii]CAD1785395.1 similar to Saccharomyces cerevisiae YGL010W Putative protein of unknown function [Kazachstania barnettii]
MKHSLLDLRSQLRFYKFYHHNDTNVAIHAVFVPTILVTSASLLHRFTLYKSITLTHVLTVGYAVFYCLLSLPVGMMASALLILLNVALDKKWLNTTQSQDTGIFVLSWICQFIGHGVFERRKPALLDNLVQSLVLAPYFILFEFLFKLGLYKDLNQQLKQDIATISK